MLPALLPQLPRGQVSSGLAGVPLVNCCRGPDSTREGCVFHLDQWSSTLAAHSNDWGQQKNNDQRLDLT